MFVSRALGGGAEACVEDWGLMKSSTTVACCVCLPFRPAATTTEMKGGGSSSSAEGHLLRLFQI